jgi:hypothetical protein
MHIINLENFNKIIQTVGIQIFEEEKHDGLPFSITAKLSLHNTGKFHLTFKAYITEEMVGISENNVNEYYVTWELITRQIKNSIEYIVFSGWSDVESGGRELRQFENVKIGIRKEYFIQLLLRFREQMPEFFTKDKLKNIIGLENVFV